jgi:hypothetical protein
MHRAGSPLAIFCSHDFLGALDHLEGKEVDHARFAGLVAGELTEVRELTHFRCKTPWQASLLQQTTPVHTS